MSLSASYTVELKHVKIAGRHLFQDKVLSLARHQFNVLLGPSGSGKTTLLRYLAGLGDVGGSPWPETPRLSWLAQNDGLLPWKSVRNNVLLGSLVRGERINSALTDKALGLLDEMELGERADDLPGVLSGGMRQRVALARTLMEDSELILMDEPFTALDSRTKLDMQILSARLLHGRTVVLVTHDLHEAVTMADHLYRLEGSPARIGSVKLPTAQKPLRDIDSMAVTRCVAELRQQMLRADA